MHRDCPRIVMWRTVGRLDASFGGWMATTLAGKDDSNPEKGWQARGWTDSKQACWQEGRRPAFQAADQRPGIPGGRGLAQPRQLNWR